MFLKGCTFSLYEIKKNADNIVFEDENQITVYKKNKLQTYVRFQDNDGKCNYEYWLKKIIKQEYCESEFKDNFFKLYNLTECPITLDLRDGLEYILQHSIFERNHKMGILAPTSNTAPWSYQVSYYVGGYFDCGIGKTRDGALLDQFCKIIKSKIVPQNEKDIVINKVLELLKGRK